MKKRLKYQKNKKILDLIDLVSLMHSKTTYYEKITINDIKQIYEDIGKNIEYLKIYYDVLMTEIETKEFMSPKEYYLARNISLIYLTLDNLKYDLDNWYKKNKEKKVID